MIPARLLCVFAAGSSVLAAVPEPAILSPRDLVDGLAGILNSRAACASYKIQSGDTCFTIASAENVTWAQLTAWNPTLNGSCGNLQSLSSICVSNPAGNYTMPVGNNGTSGIVTTTAAIPSPTVSGTNSRCGRWALVGSGNDCSTLTDQYSIDLKDFLFLNPEVWANCTNLYVNYYYCVEAVGYISTYPGYLPTSTTSPFSKTPATSLPASNGGNPLANKTMPGQIIPLANGTRTDCASYVWFNSVAGNPGADCWNLAFAYDKTPEEIVLWNPSLGDDSASGTPVISMPGGADMVGAAAATATTTASTSISSNAYDYPCTLSANSSYCVNLVMSTVAATNASSIPTTTPIVTPVPIAAGESKNCTAWVTASADTLCTNILAAFQITMAEFYAMNPTVGTDCSGLDAGTNYCVSTDPDGEQPPFTDTGSGTLSFVTTFSGWVSEAPTQTGRVTPSPIQTGMVKDCNKFYLVKKGDGCTAIESTYKLSFDLLYSWNPALGSNCQYLDVGDYICVGVVSTSTAKSTTATHTGVVTPSPIQTGMVKNCNKFYEVKKGDSCTNIESDHSVTFAQLYKWNPAIGSNCQYLVIGDYICVSVPTTAATTTKKPTGVVTPTPHQTGMVKDCNKFYEVKKGDSCTAIESSHKVTFAQLYKWNPAIGSNCQTLEVGDYICVGVPTTATTTKKPTGVVTPSPHQTGMVKNCNKFYKVKSGDSCTKVESSQKVTFAQLFKWNPALGSDCHYLDVGDYICVGVS